MAGSSEFASLLSALGREVEAARSLIEAQRACEDAVRRALSAEELERRLARQEQAIEACRAAATERGRLLAGPDAVERWLVGLPTAERELLRASVLEARRLREEIRSQARRMAYVAQRSAEWCDTRRRELTTLLVRAQSAEGGYGALAPVPPQRGVAWKVDRAA